MNYAPPRMGIPMRPDHHALAEASSVAVIRACIASAMAGPKGDPELIARSLWPNDRLASNLVTVKATSDPAVLEVPAWAGALGRSVVADYLAGLGPVSAAADVFSHALRLSFNINAETKAAEVHLPHFVAEHGNAGFFRPGFQNISVHSLTLTDPDVLTPYWIGGIGIFTNEMIRSSNVEALAADAMDRAVGRAIDEILFDANPKDDVRPAGLRYGVTAVPPSSETDSDDAFYEDMANLAQAVSPIAGNGPLVFVASSARRLKMRLRMPRDLEDVFIYASGAVQNDLLCIVPSALAFIVGTVPRIEDSGSTIIESDGTKKSIFQLNGTAKKLVLPITWSRRDPRAFAFTTPSAW